MLHKQKPGSKTGVGNLWLFHPSVVALCGYQKINDNLPACAYLLKFYNCCSERLNEVCNSSILICDSNTVVSNLSKCNISNAQCCFPLIVKIVLRLSGFYFQKYWLKWLFQCKRLPTPGPEEQTFGVVEVH